MNEAADYKPLLEPTKDTPYFRLTGELWGVLCEDFRENWHHYNDTALFHSIILTTHRP